MATPAASLMAAVGCETSGLAKGLAAADAMVRKGAKDMANSAKSAGDVIGAEISKGITDKLKNLGTMAGVGMAVAEVYDLAKMGAGAERVGAAFREQFGVQAVAGLDKLRAASHGTISDLDLMLVSNKAAALGVTTDTETLSRLLEVAAVRGRAMGVSTAQAFSDISVGVGRLSPLILDNLGIVTGGEATYADYGRSIGKAASELTDMEKRQALLNKILAESVTLTRDSAEGYEQLAARMDNLKASGGKVIDNLWGPTGGAALERKVSGYAKTAEDMATVSREAMGLGTNLIGLAGINLETAKSNDVLALALGAGYAASNPFTLGMWAAAQGVSGLAASIGPAVSEVERLIGALLGIKSAAAGMPNYAGQGVVPPAAPLGRAELQGRLSGQNDALARQVDLMKSLQTGVTLNGQPYYPTTGAGSGDAGAGVRFAGTAVYTPRGGGGGGGGAASAASQAAEQARAEARSMVESILSPSTARYVGGVYQEAWDEYVRRLKSAVSDPKSAWKGLLGGRSGEEAKRFAAEEEEKFYAGLSPQNISWSAFDAAYAHLLQAKAGREAMIATAMARVGGQGGKADVMAALGIKGGADAAGLDMAAGFATGLAASPGAEELTLSFGKELETQRKAWVSMGALSVSWFRTGLTGTSQATLLEMTKSLFPVLWPLIEARLGPRP